jgi:hypothetical protein
MYCSRPTEFLLLHVMGGGAGPCRDGERLEFALLQNFETDRRWWVTYGESGSAGFLYASQVELLSIQLICEWNAAIYKGRGF